LEPESSWTLTLYTLQVSARGSIQLCGQQIQVGMAHARTVVSVEAAGKHR
jgi:hypothetical protein